LSNSRFFIVQQFRRPPYSFRSVLFKTETIVVVGIVIALRWRKN
jgi:hypothetical protein